MKALLLFVELASFSSPPKLKFLSQAGSCLFYNSREEARPQRMCFLLVLQVLVQSKVRLWENPALALLRSGRQHIPKFYILNC